MLIKSGYTARIYMKGSTWDGHVWNDSGTANDNLSMLPDTMRFNNDSSYFITVAASGFNPVSKHTKFIVNNKKMIIDDRNITNPGNLIVTNGSSIKTDRYGSGLHIAYGLRADPNIKMNGGGYLAWGSNTVRDSSGQFISLQATDSLAGTYNFYNNAAGISDTLNGFKYFSGQTVSMGFSTSANSASTFVVNGKLDFSTNKGIISVYSNSTNHKGAKFYFLDTVTGGQLTYGGAGAITIDFGTKPFTFVGAASPSWKPVSSIDTLIFHDNVITNGRTWLWGANDVIQGNFTVRHVGFTVDDSVRSNLKHFRKWINARTTTTKTTGLLDTMYCDSSFIDSAGKFVQNGFPIYTRDCEIYPADSFRMSGKIEVSRNLILGASSNIIRTAGGHFVTSAGSTHTITTNGKRIDSLLINGTTTINGGNTLLPMLDPGVKTTFQTGQTFTFLAGYDIDGTAGNLDSIVGGTINIPANDSVSYAYFKDVTLATGDTIWVTNGIDGTGNSSNIIFPPTDTIPIIAAITPTSSSTAGGDSATITLSVAGGQNIDTVIFGDESTVLVNGYKVKIPAHAHGVVDIIVANSAGRDTLPNAFTYIGIPEITSITPAHVAPGTEVTIEGTVFGDSPTAMINGSALTPTSRSDVSFVFNAPSLTAGEKEIILTNSSYGTKDTIALHYDTIPNLISIVKAYGKLAGGDTVKLYATNATGIDTVWIGANKATIVTKYNDSVKLVTPSSSTLGAFGVRTFAEYGYRDTLPAAFTFTRLIYNLRVSPPSGDTAGGTSLLFKAAYGLTGATCSAVNSFNATSDTTGTATSKAGTKGIARFIFTQGVDTAGVNYTYTAGNSKKLFFFFGKGK
jgi:hypothetical protein